MSFLASFVVPGGYGASTDLTAPQRFFRTDEGILGLALFFEIQPVGDINSSPPITTQAMESVGFVAANRYRTTNIVPPSYLTFKAITKNMSAAWISVSDGSGDIVSALRDQLMSVLNELPTSDHCNGMICSLVLAQNIVGQAVTMNYGINYSIGLQNSMPQCLFFLSSTVYPSVLGSRQGSLFRIGLLNVPRFAGTVAPYYFWGINDRQLKLAYTNLY